MESHLVQLAEQKKTTIKSKPDLVGSESKKLAEPDSSLKLLKVEIPPGSPAPIEAEQILSLEIKQNSLSPLSENAKLAFIETLKGAEAALLKQALVDAALNRYIFPRPISEKMDNLQYVLFQNKENESVRPCIEQAITALVTTEAFDQLKIMLEKPIELASWNSAFLYFLAKRLNIKIEQAPIVQATIKDGKIYWRILKEDKEIYDRQKAKGIKGVSFPEETSWRMDWNLFRIFKDSGKRSSSVVITKELFIAKFGGDEHKNIAASIWDDLQAIGIINPKHRLSHGWRTLSKVSIKLKTIEDLEYPTIKSTKENKSKWYNHIITTLNLIVNDQGNAEILEAMPGARIYRPEISLKKWAGTGNVTHDSPESIQYCTRLWDVGVYDELSKHRSSGEEKKKYGGEILNYDHIPSTSALKNSSSPVSKNYVAAIKKHNEELRAIRSEIIALEGDSKGLLTRQQAQIPLDPKITEAIVELKKQEANISQLLEKQTVNFDIEAENLAFAIAIPKKLHKQGETFLESAQAQSLSKAHPFLRDVTAYLDILEARPQDFKLESHDDYIKALGAFRYLYRAQCKQPTSLVGGGYSIGRISHSFFQDAAVKKEIDTLFQKRIKSFMEKREGEINIASSGKPIRRSLFS